MIADIYKCPKCGMNVYLAQDEDYCPLCAENDRDHMELVELGVDLEEDSNLDEPRYANFDHLLEVLQFRFGYDAANYAIDCWKYAWDATKTDLANADKLNAFLDNPNGVISGRNNKPMSEREIKQEVERIMYLIISKGKYPRNASEWVDQVAHGFVNTHPVSRIYISKKLTYVAAETCFKHTHLDSVYNYSQLEKDKPIPKKKDDYYIFDYFVPSSSKCIKLRYKKKEARIKAEYIAHKCTTHKWWESLGWWARHSWTNLVYFFS